MDRCYVVFGKDFKAMKIKGITEKKNLIKSLKKKGYKPKSSLLNCKSKSGKTCKRTPTAY